MGIWGVMLQLEGHEKVCLWTLRVTEQLKLFMIAATPWTRVSSQEQPTAFTPAERASMDCQY